MKSNMIQMVKGNMIQMVKCICFASLCNAVIVQYVFAQGQHASPDLLAPAWKMKLATMPDNWPDKELVPFLKMKPQNLLLNLPLARQQ